MRTVASTGGGAVAGSVARCQDTASLLECGRRRRPVRVPRRSAGITTMISGTLQLPTSRNEGGKLNIATPAYKGEYCAAYVRSLYSLLSAAPGLGLRFAFSEIDYADIVTARNYLISNFYYNKTDCSHLLFLDADMGYPRQLIAEMVALKEELVGVVYPRRSIDLRRLHSLQGQPYAKAYAQACSFIGTPGDPHPRNPGFRRVDGCGTGIMLISRSCISRMLECCPEIIDTRRFKRLPFGEKFSSFLTPFNKIELDDMELSEDLSFCRRWIEACGGSIYANVTHDIEHVGSLSIRTAHADLL